MLTQINVFGVRCALLGSVLVLTACGSDNDDQAPTMPEPPAPTVYRYQIEVTNLSHAQPMSPLAVKLDSENPWWKVGEPASEALEIMAEGGDNEALLDSGGLATASGDDILGPGAQQVIEISVEDMPDSYLSVATMLVNTNDGFTGLTHQALADLEAGDSWYVLTPVYDAGTEANTERMGSIPGPADNGSGFEAMRDDVNFVARHPGVVTGDDGLSTSVLTQAHRFDNPILRVKVTRLE